MYILEKEKIMKAKVLGGVFFKSKNGKDLVTITCQDNDRLNSVGIVTRNIMAFKESLPCELKDMINKIYVIDTDTKDGTTYAKEFFEIKDK